MIESAIELCKLYMLHTSLTKEDMVVFITLVKQVTDTDILNSLMKMFNTIVTSGWSASSSPFSCILFPGERNEPAHDLWVRRPWASFHLPPDPKMADFFRSASFCVSLWVSVTHDKNVRTRFPIHLVSIGSRRLSLELWVHNYSLIARVVTELRSPSLGKENPGEAIYFSNLLQHEPQEQWQNVTFNCSVNGADIFRIEAVVNGRRFKDGSGQLHLRSVIPSNVCLTEGDTTRVIHVGEQRGNALGNPPLKYSHAWVFSSSLTIKQALFLYLLGPCVTSLDQMKVELSQLHRPRLQIVKKVLQYDPTCAAVIDEFKKNESNEEIPFLRLSLLASHVSSMGGNLLYYPQPDSPNGPKSLIASLLNVTQQTANNQDKDRPEALEPPIVLPASEANETPKLDLYSGSWCSSVEENGGFGMLLLLLARTVEIGSSDSCLSIVLDALLTALEAANHSFIREAAFLEAFVLIKKVLSSAGERKLGLFTLKVLIDHTFTQSLLECDEKMERFSLRSNFVGIVYHHDCLNLMINCWKLWSNDRHEKSFSATEAMLASLVAVLQDSHVYRDVNIDILRKLGLIKKLAFAMKAENIEEVPISHVVPSIIEIFSALVGSPPDLTVVSELMQVALFLHDSTNTYIHHAKNSFYFTLPSIMNASASMTWPRVSTSHRNASTTLTLSKSASFNAKSISTYDEVEEEAEGQVLEEALQTSPPNDTKLNPDRLRKILSSNKRNHHYYIRRQAANTPDHEVREGIVHFGHLSRLENKPHSPTAENQDVSNHQELSDVQDGNESVNSEGESFHHSVGPIEGILNILHGAMLNMPDSSVMTTMTSVILPEYILILVNHPDPFVRLSATRLLSKYVQRTCRLYPNGFRVDKIEGYQLLAAQLFTWGFKPVPGPVIDRLSSSILSLVHGVEIYSTSRIPELPTRGAKVRSSALPPLLALLPNLAAAGSGHLATLHSLIVHLHDIIARVHNFLKLEHEPLGLFEALCKTAECLVSSPLELWTSDIVGQDGREIILEDLDYLFRFMGKEWVLALKHFRKCNYFLQECILQVLTARII